FHLLSSQRLFPSSSSWQAVVPAPLSVVAAPERAVDMHGAQEAQNQTDGGAQDAQDQCQGDAPHLGAAREPAGAKYAHDTAASRANDEAEEERGRGQQEPEKTHPYCLLVQHWVDDHKERRQRDRAPERGDEQRHLEDAARVLLTVPVRQDV